MLRLAGVEVEKGDNEVFGGVPYAFAPKILLEPSFAITFAEIKAKFQGKVKIAKCTSMVLGGNPNLPNELTVAGTVIARKQLNFFDHFTEESIDFLPVKAGEAEEIYLIRGYKPSRQL